MDPDKNIKDLVDAPVEPEEVADTLIFPINVHDSLASSGSLKRGEKTGIIASFWVAGCALLGWFLASWLRNILPGHYGWVVLGIEVVLQLTVGVLLLRFLLDESTAVSELENKDNSFAKYFQIYREVCAGEGSPYPFDVMEFSDGSYGVNIRLLYGYNTTQNSRNTYDINKAIQLLINKSGMAHRKVYSREPFGSSKAADNLRAIVRNISDPELFTAYRSVVQGYLDIAARESNVMCATYIIYAKTRIQKDALTQLVTQILNIAESEDSAYRDVYVMPYHEIVEFYRDYYRLDVFDMGLVRATAVQTKRVSCPVRVLRVYGNSGRVYNTSELKRFKQRLLEEHGLQQMN